MRSGWLAIVALATATGCAGGASAVPPGAFSGGGGPSSDALAAGRAALPASRTWIVPGSKKSALVYISDSQQDSLTIFDAATGAVTGHIGGLSATAGLFVDKHHQLWVANSGNGEVLVYKRGATSPFKTLTDPYERPFDAVVCPNGTVYVSNYYSFQTGIGGVSVYANGSTTPTGTLSDPNEFENFFITCDKKNNVFTTVELGNLDNQVDEYPGGNGPAQKIVGLDSSGGITMDPAGNLVVSDPDAHTISEYTETGTPTGNVIQTGNTRLIFGIAVSRDGLNVLGANAGGGGQAFALWTGSAGQAYNAKFTEPLGAAYDPAEKKI